jgi:hypothetical protein
MLGKGGTFVEWLLSVNIPTMPTILVNSIVANGPWGDKSAFTVCVSTLSDGVAWVVVATAAGKRAVEMVLVTTSSLEVGSLHERPGVGSYW